MAIQNWSEITDNTVAKPTYPGDTAETEAARLYRIQVAGFYKQQTKTAAGATTSIPVDRLTGLTVQINAAVSVNNAQIQGSVDDSNWATAIGSAIVSGTTVTIKNISAQYRYVRGNVDTYSSGTVTFDFFGRGI